MICAVFYLRLFIYRMPAITWNRWLRTINVAAHNAVPIKFSWLKSSWPFPSGTYYIKNTYLCLWRDRQIFLQTVPIWIDLSHYNVQLRIVEYVRIAAFDLVPYRWVVTHTHLAQLGRPWVPQFLKHLWLLFKFVLSCVSSILWLFLTSATQIQLRTSYGFTLLCFLSQ